MCALGLTSLTQNSGSFSILSLFLVPIFLQGSFFPMVLIFKCNELFYFVNHFGLVGCKSINQLVN